MLVTCLMDLIPARVSKHLSDDAIGSVLAKERQALTVKAPPIICSRRQFQIRLPFQKITIRQDNS